MRKFTIESVLLLGTQKNSPMDGKNPADMPLTANTEQPARYVFIINPIAGMKNKKRIENSILRAFAPGEALVIYSEGQGHAQKIASEFVRKATPYCIAVGGDGTVNEVASALVNTDTVLGIIPAGSGNGLSNYLHIPHVVKQAIEVIQHNFIRTIDAGKLNDQYFFCTCGIGFDALVGHDFARGNQRGLPGYIRSALKQFIRYRPKKYRLKIDGQKQKVRAFLITMANAGQYGNNFYISPGAKIDDGLLDICIVKPFPKAAVLPLGIRFLGRRIDRSPYLEVIRGKKVTLRGRKKKQNIHYDGEPMVVSGKIKIQIFPGALKVLVPESVKSRLTIRRPEITRSGSPEIRTA
jgi:diacylglycerol kinase (ATP)